MHFDVLGKKKKILQHKSFEHFSLIINVPDLQITGLKCTMLYLPLYIGFRFLYKFHLLTVSGNHFCLHQHSIYLAINYCVCMYKYVEFLCNNQCL